MTRGILTYVLTLDFGFGVAAGAGGVAGGAAAAGVGGRAAVGGATGARSAPWVAARNISCGGTSAIIFCNTFALLKLCCVSHLLSLNCDVPQPQSFKCCNMSTPQARYAAFT